MLHIEFADDSFVVSEDHNTLKILYAFCRRGVFSRTFSNWQQLTTVWDILQMLGFTIGFLPDVNANGQQQYKIYSWFGNDSDTGSVHDLQYAINRVYHCENG